MHGADNVMKSVRIVQQLASDAVRWQKEIWATTTTFILIVCVLNGLKATSEEA